MLDVVGRQPRHHAGVAAVDQAEVQGQQPRPAGAEPVPACGPRQLWRLLPWPQHGPGQHRQHGRDRPNAQARLPVTEMAADVWTEYCRQAAAAHQRRRVQPHRPGQTAREPAVDQPRHHALHHRHAQAGDHRTGNQRPGAVQLQAPQAGQGDGRQATEHAAMFADPAPQPGLQQRHQAHAQHRQRRQQGRLLVAQAGAGAHGFKQRADTGQDRPQVQRQQDHQQQVQYSAHCESVLF
ncbi:hypothetical protein D9M71_348120 [compost metagenome]